MKKRAKKIKVKKDKNNYKEMKFQTFCWSFGTTSFRVKDLAYKLYSQLVILKELKFEYPGKTWQELQGKFYDKMHKAGLATGDAKRKEKDARQFTSSLVQLGLTDEERIPTEVGEKLIRVIESSSAGNANILKLKPEAFIFFKQMLKLRMDFNGRDYKEFKIKPYQIIIYMLLVLEYLTYEELTYFVPLCKTVEEANETIGAIKKFRAGKLTVEVFLRGKIEQMTNYKSALDYFLNEKVDTAEKFAAIGIGRKGKKYDEIYFYIYNQILVFQSCKTDKARKKAVEGLLSQLKKVKDGEIKKNWSKLLFGSAKLKNGEDENISALDGSRIVKIKNENEFKTEFFYFLHVNKWIATLDDYFDLNKRFLSLTETIVFADGKATLDIIPKAYFAPIVDKLRDETINYTDNDAANFGKDLNIEDVYPYLIKSEDVLRKSIATLYPDYDISKPAAQYVHGKRVQRLNKIILDKFKPEDIKNMFLWFKNRNDADIASHFKDCEASIPTIFEYVMAIIWYLISERKVDVLEALNLTLDVNLLPKVHAAGGQSDIVFKYRGYNDLPDHDLLLEVTLTEKDSQRRNEMEPVSRHLGQYLIRINENAYAVFLANFIDNNVLCDFRQRKTTPFYDNGKSVQGLKIIPLDLIFLEKIVDENVNYDKLFAIFEKAYNDGEMDGVRWYNDKLNNEFNNLKG
ncbi:MAG: AlwI family type II restriction endonuclease [Candidatus Goldbacteria bacterium]|nr:AlwI family type II restriction endonuclease [Candidatus Goldiibacteriota bacterium]